MSGTSTGALTRVATSSYANETSFKKGYVGGPGRPKGSRNRVQADLARLVVQAAANTGFVVIKDGNPVPGERGTLGYLEWAALYHSKTFLSLLARVLPYHIVEAARDPYSHARIGDRGDKGAGLPPALMTMLLQAAPKPQLDLDEDPNPYGVIDVRAAPGTDTGGVKEIRWRECETTVRACIALNPKVSVEFCVHLFLVPGRSSHAPLPVARIDVPVVPWRLIDGPATARNL